ncbi:hypothetical protein A1Q2_04325 [Trichosporon asahii var. asahii CBS 8904]|uniref:RNA polymerase II elongation factor ELL N-terminal domain-containing protein n=1 Tax=Trichosporon asahii var. asahii (strain CBS 8904) TaxID=1220162 RepID=K1VX07_TRIAC|nr:hypothetical protein A1Q2_04325 [Trichosporon asahii var. asahii CBS 8904]
MPLPSGTVPVAPSAADTPPPPAFLVRFPEDTWAKLAAADGEVTITVGDDMTLNLPGQEPIRLDSQTAQQSELYAFDPSAHQLAPIGVADARLSVPFSAASVGRAAEKVRLQNAALDAQREARAARVMGTKPSSHSRQTSLSSLPQRPSPSPAPPMARTLSGPAASTLGSSMGEKIPLKTRVVQFLALGPTTVDEILEHTQGDYNDVLRVAKVIGLHDDGQYRLRPAQYAKIKIGSWKYTHDEKVRVIALARQAFDELGLAPDAEERDELDQKEREALGSTGSGASASPAPQPAPSLSPVKQKQLSLSPQKPLPSLSRSASPAGAPAAPAPTKKAAKAAGPKTKVAKQIAKMRNDHIAKQRSSSATGASRVASPLPGVEDSDEEQEKEKERERKREEEEEKKREKEREEERKQKEREAKEREREQREKEQREREKPPPKKRATVSAAAAAAAGLPEKPVSAINASRKPPSAENGKRGDKPAVDKKRRSTHDYTSSESDSEPEAGEVRGRARTKKTVAVTKERNGKANGHRDSTGRKRTSPVYTSSEDEGPPLKKRASPEKASLMDSLSSKRRGSPAVTVTTTKVKKANGASNGGAT